MNRATSFEKKSIVKSFNFENLPKYKEKELFSSTEDA